MSAVNFLAEIPGHRSLVSRVRWSPDGRYLASPSDDQTIRIWHTRSQTLRQTITKGHAFFDPMTDGSTQQMKNSHRIHGVSWDPTGTAIASAGADGTVTIWNAQFGSAEAALKGHEGMALSVDWSPDTGRRIASGGEDQTLRVWDAVTHQAIHEVRYEGATPTGAFVLSVAWSADETKLAVGLSDGRLIVYESASWTPVLEKQAHLQTYSLCWLPGDSGVVSGGAGQAQQVRVWLLGSDEVTTLGEDTRRFVSCVDVSPDGLLLAAKAMNEVRLYVRSGRDWRKVGSMPEGPSGWWASGCAFNPQTPILASLGDHDTSIRLWSLDLEQLAGASEVAESNWFAPSDTVPWPKGDDSLRVFICHANEDKSRARGLYRQLRVEGFSPWLDEEDLLPGVDWEDAIERAVGESHVVLVLLSTQSMTKTGYVQKEIRLVLDAAERRPPDAMFVMPVTLGNIALPQRLSRWQAVDLNRTDSMQRLIRGLHERERQVRDGIGS